MGMGSMGFALPSVIGAYFASDKKQVVMLEGDGSLQLNLQELQTINTYGINAKMFIWSNTGYAAITTMQERNFDGFYVGSNPQSGVDLGGGLRKVRMAIGSKGRGKSHGARVITFTVVVAIEESETGCQLTGKSHKRIFKTHFLHKQFCSLLGLCSNGNREGKTHLYLTVVHCIAVRFYFCQI